MGPRWKRPTRKETTKSFWRSPPRALKGEGGRRVAEHKGVFIRKFDRIEGLFLVGLGHGRVLLRRPVDGRVKRGHQQAGVQYGSGPCFLYLLLDRGLLLTYSFVFINVSWTGPVATRYEQIGFYVTDTVAKVIWAIAAGKSRIDEEGARSVVLGLSCPSHGTSPWVNSPMRSGTPSTVRHRSDSQLRGLPRSSSGSRFRT